MVGLYLSAPWSLSMYVCPPAKSTSAEKTWYVLLWEELVSDLPFRLQWQIIFHSGNFVRLHSWVRVMVSRMLGEFIEDVKPEAYLFLKPLRFGVVCYYKTTLPVLTNTLGPLGFHFWLLQTIFHTITRIIFKNTSNALVNPLWWFPMDLGNTSCLLLQLLPSLLSLSPSGFLHVRHFRLLLDTQIPPGLLLQNLHRCLDHPTSHT